MQPTGIKGITRVARSALDNTYVPHTPTVMAVDKVGVMLLPICFCGSTYPTSGGITCLKLIVCYFWQIGTEKTPNSNALYPPTLISYHIYIPSGI